MVAYDPAEGSRRSVDGRRYDSSQRFDNHAATFYDADSDLAAIEQSHAQQGSALGGERDVRHLPRAQWRGTRPAWPSPRRPESRSGRPRVATPSYVRGRQSEVTGEARIYDGLDLGGVPKGTCHCEGYDGLPSPGDYRAGDGHGDQARKALVSSPGYPVLGLPMRAEGRPGSPTGWP